MDHYKYVETVSVDLNMAFDNVDHNILVQKLNNYGVQGLDLILFESYLSDCKQCTTIESVDSSIKKINLGVPQDSFLGPLSFLSFTANQLACIDFEGKTHAWAFLIYSY